MSIDSKIDRLSQRQVAALLNYVYTIRIKKGEQVEPNEKRKWRKLNTKLQLSTAEKSFLKDILIKYNKFEALLIDILENLITVLENSLFLLSFLKKTSKWTNYLDRLVIKISKIWMVLTVKSSVTRYWKLIKLESAMLITDSYDKLVAKLKFYTLVNLGLCLVEVIELLDLKSFSWLIKIYNVYRMVGNGGMYLEDNEEKTLQDFFSNYDM